MTGLAALGVAGTVAPVHAAEFTCLVGEMDCWQNRGQHQPGIGLVAYWGQTFAFSFHSEPSIVRIGRQGGSSAGLGPAVGYQTYPGGGGISPGTLPSPIRSIVVSQDGTFSQPTVRILGEDSWVRVAWAEDDPLYEEGTHFPIVEDLIEPILEDGTPITLCQITAAKLNVNAPQVPYLLGRGCTGQLYYSKGAHWGLAADYAPLAGAPTSGIQSISTIGAGRPVLLTQSGEVWFTGRGTMNCVDGACQYVPLPPIQAPPILNDAGDVLGIESSGGLFALTDAGDGTCRYPEEPQCRGDEDRIYKFNVSANVWEHFANGALPYYPSESRDIASCEVPNPAGGTRTVFGCNLGVTCDGGDICDYYVSPRYYFIHQTNYGVVVQQWNSWVYLWESTPTFSALPVPDMGRLSVEPYGGTDPSVLVDDTESYTQAPSSLLIDAPGFSEVTTEAFPVPVVGSDEILIDVYVPQSSPSGWSGMVQFYMHLPSQGINHDWVGQAYLPNGTGDTWETLSVPIPNNILNAMFNGEGESMQLGIAVNSPFGGAGTGVRIDNLRVAGAGN